MVADTAPSSTKLLEFLWLNYQNVSAVLKETLSILLYRVVGHSVCRNREFAIADVLLLNEIEIIIAVVCRNDELISKC